jgi:hypothetical protein
LAEISKTSSKIAGTIAGNDRREQGWKHQQELAEHELKQIEKKLIAAEIRKQIAEKSLDIHKRSIGQAEEMFELYGNKFSNLGLYTWLSKTLHGLYRDAYNSAFSMARLAEQAYQYERGYDASVSLGAGSWEASRSGLLAGERLTIALQQMEQRFIETNYRPMEIDQSFSLRRMDPEALIDLKAKGSVSFTIPELYFDLTYPGQYKRKIKAVRISIPCVCGPYTNVGARLTLTSSKVRVEADSKMDALKDVPLRRSISIATSKASNDGGVFEFNFNDQRYMPFEGAGAAESSWKLTLPRNFRMFDYSTITDVILHISYTAEDGGDEFQSSVEKNIGNVMKKSENRLFAQVLDLRHDYPDEWHSFVEDKGDKPVFKAAV